AEPASAKVEVAKVVAVEPALAKVEAAKAEPAPAKVDALKAAPAKVVGAKAGAPKKRLGGDELLAELFEASGDLHFARDALEGAEMALNATLDKLPSELGLVSLFDMNKREFVVVRQVGGPRSALLARQPEKAPIASQAMRKRRAVVVSGPAGL